eukprot:g1202.t1
MGCSSSSANLNGVRDPEQTYREKEEKDGENESEDESEESDIDVPRMMNASVSEVRRAVREDTNYKKRDSVTIQGKGHDAGAANLSSFSGPVFLQNILRFRPSSSFTQLYRFPCAGEEGVLGRGISGTVKLIEELSNKRKFALKVLAVSKVTEESMRHSLLQEIETLKTLDHPNIVRVYETFQQPDDDVLMVMELLHGGELFDWILHQPDYRFIEPDARSIVLQILDAIKYLHNNNIVHRDIKLENFMFASKDKEATLKLIDFGFSRTYLPWQTKKEVVSGTLYTMAPEVFQGSATFASDMWSVGVLAFILMAGRRPFDDKDLSIMEQKICEGKYRWPRKIWAQKYPISDDAKDFVSKLICLDEANRMSATDAFMHPWFSADLNGADYTLVRGSPEVQRSVSDPFSAVSLRDIQGAVNSLKRFSKAGLLKKAVLLAIASSVPSDRVRKITKIFHAFDTSHSGTINRVEFKAVLMRAESIGFTHENWTESILDELFADMDQDDTGLIKYSEFVAACLDDSGLVDEDAVSHVFRMLDRDNGGEITRENLLELLTGSFPASVLSAERIEQTIDNMIAEGDINMDGAVSEKELFTIIF